VILQQIASRTNGGRNVTLAEAVSVGRTAEVTFDGTVSTPPRYVRSASGLHEHFRVHSDDGVDVAIADNVSIAPRCPVRPGDRVEIRGEFARAYADGSPLVHWTHHDPTAHHPDGFIEYDGHRYA
jgi:hypothetical protein